MFPQAAKCSSAQTLKFSSCFICYQNVDTTKTFGSDDVHKSETSQKHKTQSKEILDERKYEIGQRFQALACRFLKFNLESLENPEETLKTKIDKDESKYNQICENCYPVIESFCDIYQTWTNLLVQLNRRTTEIAEIMMAEENEELVVSSNTISNKMTEFKKRFLQQVDRNSKAFPELKLTNIGEEQNQEDDENPSNSEIQTQPQSPDVHEICIKVEPQEVIHLDFDEENVYKCILCEAEFSDNKIFLEHLRIHNWEDDDDSMINEDSQFADDHFGNHNDHDHDQKLFALEHVNQGNDEIVGEGEFSVKRHIFNRSVSAGSTFGDNDDDDDEYQFETLVPEGFRLKRHPPDSDGPHVHGGEVVPQTAHQWTSNFEYSEDTMDSMDFPMGDRTEEGDSSGTQCKYCGKTFKYACRLKIHMRVHSGEKPYECEICGQRFSQRSSKNRHEGTHNRQKEKNCLQCKICGKRFQQSSTYKIHKLRHHTGEVVVVKNGTDY